MNVSAAARKPVSFVQRRRQHRDRLQAVKRAKMALFADLIADGYTQTAAARQLGVSQQCGNGYFLQMRRDLGYQAEEFGDPIRPEFRGRPDLACAAIERGESIV